MLAPRPGSSPLARGPLPLKPHVRRPDRFIPAGAGNTTSYRAGWLQRPVHPRWRGEHFRSVSVPPPWYGSSPLARGTPDGHRAAERRGRFIPAGAGNTLTFTAWKWPATVHPRWRGEHLSVAGPRNAYIGSSPLARGTRRQPAAPAAIPAVHPRWRGEHYCMAGGAQMICGSSPLARGTHQHA